MAGRASRAAKAAQAFPEAAVAVAEGQDVGEFGKPLVTIHKKEDGGQGIQSMQTKPFEAGYVEPGDRSNPDYLVKLADEKLLRDAENAQRDKARGAFGAGLAAQIFQPSPNSPQAAFKTLY